MVALQLALDHPELVGDRVLIKPPLIDPLPPPQGRAIVPAVIGPALGAAMDAAAQGDLPTAFDTFLTALCGPQHRTVIESALGKAGLQRAERDCGYCFTGEVPALTAWHLDEELARQIEQPIHLVAGAAAPASLAADDQGQWLPAWSRSRRPRPSATETASRRLATPSFA